MFSKSQSYKSRLPFSIQSLIPICGSGLMIQKTVGFFPAAFLLQAGTLLPLPAGQIQKAPCRVWQRAEKTGIFYLSS